MTGSDKLLLISSSISRHQVSSVVQNISSSPFLLNPNSSLGFLIIKPEPLYVPRTLPVIIKNVPMRHFSTEGLRSKSKKIENEILFLPPGSSSGSNFFEGFTNLTNQIKPVYQTHNIKPHKEFPVENLNFDLRSISLRCIKQKDSAKNLIPVRLHIKSLWQKSDPLELNILPWDSSLYPPETFLCTTCKVTSGLHFPDKCPSLEQCSFCSGDSSPHSKGDCPNMDFCWNCEGGHFWRSCPLPLLTRRQQELRQYGFSFSKERDKTRVSYKYNEDEEQEVVSRSQAVTILEQHFPPIAGQWRGCVLVGYNIFMIMSIIVDMAEGCHPKNKTLESLFKGLRGMIDVKWLFPSTLENQSLSGLCRALNIQYLEKKTSKPSAELKYVDRAVAEVLRDELNLSLHSDVGLLCCNYSIKLYQKSDLKGLSRKQIVAEKTLFKRLRKHKDSNGESEKDDEDEEDSSEDEDEIMKSYNSFKEKNQVHHINLLQLEDNLRYILSIKTFEVGGKRYLHSLSLGTIQGKILLNFEAIIPAGFYNKIPDGLYGRYCRICHDTRKPTLHAAEDCPSSEPCTIHPPEVKSHKKFACNEDRCWNCGEMHNWKRCPQTILTETQQFLATVGYKASSLDKGGKRLFTFTKEVDNVEVIVDCEREDRVYARLIRLLESSKRERKKNVLLGYNVAEQLYDLMQCCEESDFLKEEIANHVHAVCDLQWMPQFEKETKGLQDILQKSQSGKKKVKLKETLDVVKEISSLLSSKDKAIDQGKKKATVKFSINLATTLAFKKPIILPPGACIKEDLVEGKEKFSLVVFVYLDHKVDEITRLELTACEMWQNGDKRQTFDGKIKIKSSKDEREMKYLVCNLVDSKILGYRGSPKVYLVTVCPESLRVFEKYFRTSVKRSLDVFDLWISLRTELSLLNHAFTKIPPHGIPFDKDAVDKINDELFANSNISTKDPSKTGKMARIYQFLEKNEVPGRVISIKHSNLRTIFFDIQFKDAKFTDEFGCPLISMIQFKMLNEQIRVCEKIDVFFNLMQMISGKIVFIGLDQEALEGLFQIAFNNSDLFESFALGVSTIEQIFGTNMIGEGNGFKYYFEQQRSSGKEEKLQVMEDIYNRLGSKPYPLISPFVNKVLLNSKKKIFSENFVFLRIPRRHWTPGKVVCDARLLKTFWNINTSEHDVKLNIFSYINPSHSEVVVPAQSSRIQVGSKNIKVVVVNKSNLPVSSSINSEQYGCIFGVLELVKKAGDESKVDREEEEEKSLPKGFDDLKDDLKKKQAVKEMVISFQKQGFSSYQEALQSILNKSSNVQALWTHLHAFVVNDFCNCGEVTELMFSRLYHQFVSSQPTKNKGKYPEYSRLLEKKYPIDWVVKSNLDGASLEFLFNYVHVNKEEKEEQEIVEVKQD